MTKIDVISGFLGAGKTTLIKKLLQEALKGEKIVLIENEFGEIGIDGGFLQEAGIEISEMNSGCICCSLVGDFGKALHKVMEEFHPDRILIEPSGVGKLSDVLKAVADVAAEEPDAVLGNAITVADGTKCKIYMKNFGEFYNNQIENAATIVLSRTQKMTGEKLSAAVAMLREKNADAAIITTPWDELDGLQILSAMDGKAELVRELMEEHHHHHHHHHDHDEHCTCGCHDHDHDHHHHDHEHDHDHHHHDHDEHCTCGCHDHDHEHHHHDHEHDHDHHHHDHDEHCTCGCHDHDHEHHHHHADEVFTSWGIETPRAYTEAEIRRALTMLDTGICGTILRSKGILPAADGGWIHFDYVPDEHEIRRGSADYTGRLCVIGAELDEGMLKDIFHVN